MLAIGSQHPVVSHRLLGYYLMLEAPFATIAPGQGIQYRRRRSPTVPRRYDPWEPFRLWLALSFALYALRAYFVLHWPGAIPGWVLLVMVQITLLLAAKALLFPGRVVPYRDGDSGWWSDLRDDWRLWWQRRRQRR
jgi:hypothetical protein